MLQRLTTPWCIKLYRVQFAIRDLHQSTIAFSCKVAATKYYRLTFSSKSFPRLATFGELNCEEEAATEAIRAAKRLQVITDFIAPRSMEVNTGAATEFHFYINLLHLLRALTNRHMKENTRLN